MSDWNAQQYLQFEDERTRPTRDLLAQVPLQRVRMAVDLGCGPGNSTERLIERYPDATVIGLDSSKDMLRQARERLPRCTFIEADLATWTPQEAVDLLFANAVYQWVPNHQMAMRRAIEALPKGGVVAAQMPDNTREATHILMQEVASRGPWANYSALAEAQDRNLITICSSRFAGMSRYGTPFTITWSTDRRRSWNGSKDRRCGRILLRSMYRKRMSFWRRIRWKSCGTTRRVLTGKHYSDFRGSSLWRPDSSG
jgi:trans-aconitate methyltransferase